MITTITIHAALARVSQDAMLVRRLSHPVCDVRFARKRLARLVLHELDCPEQPHPADVADVRMALQRLQSIHEFAPGFGNAAKKVLCFENIQYGIARGHADRMRLVSEAVLERA